ncbi:MAG: tetratricopeptide repeat protein [bacterium]
MDRRIFSIIFIIYFSSLTPYAYASIRGKVEEGNRLFEKGKYKEALTKYQEAQIDEPENPRLHFNTGDTLYKISRYEAASQEYTKAVNSSDPSIQAKTYYNLGNCAYKLGRLSEAITYYKKSLDIDPSDKDAKYNLQFVQQRLKEQPEQPKQGQDKAGQGEQTPRSKEDQKKSDGSDTRADAGKEGEKKEAEKKGKEADKRKEEKGEKEAEPFQEAKEAKMSKEDAERLLEAFKDKEREAQIKRRLMMKQRRGTTEEDW